MALCFILRTGYGFWVEPYTGRRFRALQVPFCEAYFAARGEGIHGVFIEFAAQLDAFLAPALWRTVRRNDIESKWKTSQILRHLVLQVWLQMSPSLPHLSLSKLVVLQEMNLMELSQGLTDSPLCPRGPVATAGAKLKPTSKQQHPRAFRAARRRSLSSPQTLHQRAVDFYLQTVSRQFFSKDAAANLLQKGRLS